MDIFAHCAFEQDLIVVTILRLCSLVFFSEFILILELEKQLM